MSDFVDFTVEGKHTKFFDCYIICGDDKFMTHRNMLCRLEYFDKIFDGHFKENKIENTPYCEFEEIYKNHINIFLNYLYYNKYTDDKVIVGRIIFLDFIGYNEMITLLINSNNLNSEELLFIIEYIKDKKDILNAPNNGKLYEKIVNIAFENEYLTVLDNMDIKILFKISNYTPLQYVKLIEYAYKKYGESICEYINIAKLEYEYEDDYEGTMDSDVEKYINKLESKMLASYLLVEFSKHYYSVSGINSDDYIYNLIFD